MFTIVGSGFGLYGYLPALIEGLGEPVVLPQAYREKIDARPELRGYLEFIRWAPDENAALASATAAVVATPPRRQEEVVAHCSRLPTLETLVLEKPVATTPEAAREALRALRQAGKRFRVGYTLLYTDWGESLQLPRASEFDGEVAITWTFMAHHFAKNLQNWKRDHAHGGGALRFFGVHLVALLARHGYRGVAHSALAGANPGQPESWCAAFTGPELPVCGVEVDSRCGSNRFSVALVAGKDERRLVNLRDPFEQEDAATAPGADRRIGVLRRLIDTLEDDDRPRHDFYDEVNRLWEKVESASR